MPEAMELLTEEDYGNDGPVSPSRSHLRQLRADCRAVDAKTVKRQAANWIPAIGWIPKYRKSYIFNDVIAGVTNGIMNIPQGMAYGMLAGLDPAHGLYTAFFLPLVYAFVGTSKHVALGTFAITSLMNGEALEEIINSIGVGTNSSASNETHGSLYTWFCGEGAAKHDIALAAEISGVITIMIGFILVGLSLLRMGFLAVLLSDQLVQGLTSGAALTVMTVQVKHLLGIESLKRPAGLFGLVKFYVCCIIHIKEVTPATILTSIIVITTLVVIKEIIDPKTRPKIKVPIPGELIVVVASTIVYSFTSLSQNYDVDVVGHIPRGLASPTVPKIESWVSSAITPAFTIALVLFSVECSLAKLFAKKHDYQIRPNQELFALGTCHLVGSFFGCHTGGASLSRSMIQSNQGAMSQVPSLISSAIVLTVLYAAAPLFQFLPKCVLSSIIVVALKGMYKQIGNLPPLWKKSKIDFFIWLVTFVSVLVLGITWGLVTGIAFSLLTIIFRSIWPNSYRLEWAGSKGGVYREAGAFTDLAPQPGLKIFRFDAPLYYANAERFKEELYRQSGVDPFAMRKEERKRSKRLAKSSTTQTITAPSTAQLVKTENERVRVIVVDCSSLPYMDVTGLELLRRIRADLATVKVDLWLAACHSSHLRLFAACDFYSDFPRSALLLSLPAADAAFRKLPKEDSSSSGDVPTISEGTALL